MKKIYKLIISLLIPQLAGGLGSLFTASSVGEWYQTIEKSPLNPPGWVFGPVWTTLFLLMGYALYLVWTSEGEKRKQAFGIFAVQIILNVLWSVLFFGMRSPGLALLEIVVLWVAILLNILAFSRVNKISGYLLWPYLLWVSFAIYLNYSIWSLN
ncbi:MAG: TspO/MBR family protein [Patescibacteria group bacterium]